MKRLQWLWVIVILVGCSGADPAAVETGSATAEAPTSTEASDPEAPRTWPKGLLWARTSAEIRAIYLQTYALAEAIVEREAAGREAGTWAVALDADETIIDNSLLEVEMFEAGVRYNEALYAKWADRLEAWPLPGSLGLLEKARAAGARIIIVTNRPEAICEPTRRNFEKHGIPYDLILCRPGESRDKNARWKAVQEGTASPDLPPLEIVLWMGDAIGDFPELDQATRKAGEEAFEDFGSRYLILPNPLYGSWQRNPKE